MKFGVIFTKREKDRDIVNIECYELKILTAVKVKKL